MHKKITIGIFTAILLLLFAEQAVTRSGTPPAGNTGAPGETTCINSLCHSGSAITGDISFTFGSDDTVYVPGQTYTIQVTTGSASIMYGFETTSLDPANSKAGTFIVTNVGNTQIQTLLGRDYMSHKNANSNSTWSFDWTAPVSDVGDITFYVTMNLANGNGFPSGDQIIKDVFIYPIVDLNNVDTRYNEQDLWISQIQNKLSIHSKTGMDGIASVYNINGSNIVASRVFGTLSSIQLPEITRGIYIVRIESNSKVVTRKLMIY